MASEDTNQSLVRTKDSSALTSDKLLERLKRALKKDGDFPASAKVVTELRKLTSDPRTTASQITEVILKEPSLGTRVLHLVNSSFYRRAKPIMTVSQAVVQIGMKPLAELCSGLVLLQKFVPAARQGGPFASCLQKTICTALLSGSLANEGKDGKGSGDELGYLSGSFAEIGTLLLAFYFPQIYDTAVKRSKVKNCDIGQSIQEVTGISALRLSLEVIDALGLPDFYKEVINTASEQLQGNSTAGKPPAINQAASALNAAEQISQVVVFQSSKQQLDTVMAKVKERSGIDPKKLASAVSDLSQQFRDHCSTLEVSLSPLPEFVSQPVNVVAPAGATEKTPAEPKPVDRFTQFVDEIRQAIEAREPTSSVITSVMETFAWGLKFDRVLLLLLNNDRQKLLGRMLLGRSEIDPKGISSNIAGNSDTSDVCATAFKDSRAIFFGDPKLPDGWPLCALPIGFGDRTIGVIYADRISTNPDAPELGDKEKAAIGVLGELLDRSLALNK